MASHNCDTALKIKRGPLNEIEILPIGLNDLSTLTRLPFHHRDPFDRLIIAQAVTKELPIVGKDAEFARYPVELIWHDYTSRKQSC